MPGFLEKLIGRVRSQPGEPDWKRYQPALASIRARRLELARLTNDDLGACARALRDRTATVDPSEPFAIAAEALARAVRLDPFDVQIVGALVMHDGHIAEMQTGEGKTLTAVMTIFANALSGAGVHLWTANDYLARRDAAWMRPAYELLGLSVGSINQASTREERRRAYECDVTYATANEVGFDFLRDQLALEPEDIVQRPYAFVLIDEVDSILIDEARIPLVIAGEVAPPEDIAYRMARLASGFRRNSEYTLDENARNVQLSDRGVAKIEAAFGCGNLFENRNYRVFVAAQNAVHALALLRANVDYVVKNNAIELVDEFKGRIAQNRRWPAGLQTALEAKEGLPLRKQGRIVGSVTLQSLVALYPRVCGMTGTAATQWQEFRSVYNLEIVVVPTNRPVVRVDEPDVIFADKLSKERALAREIAEVHGTGRPILVGTASVEESERLSHRVLQLGIPHEVLNARNDEAEAAIIARAGEAVAVTVSTNMAGRGTDIPLGGENVCALGGLYVIGTNKHESRRIDNQLRGRAGRQGDPGSSRFFVSLEDDVMERYGIREALDVDPSTFPPGESIDDADVRRAVESIQRVVEGQNLEIRRTLWKYEGLTEHHRREMSTRRGDVLFRRAASLAGEAPMSEIERRVTLFKIDDLWSDYLAAISELRGGIHWVSWTGKDPLHTYLTEANRIFDEMTERLDEEIREALEDEDAARAMEDTFDRGATWTYLINDQPFGSMMERWAKAAVNQVKAMLGR